MRLMRRIFKSSPSASKDPFPSGIKQLHSSEDSTVDIVFVHGLTGDREKTWTANGASGPWPELLLPRKVPTARILTFGYDARVVDWRGVVSENRIGNHASNLMTSLSLYREEHNTNQRPIIFVCHSLGGLVCENALITAKHRPESRYQNLVHSTRAIIFLGTPHHGAGLAQWAEKISKHIGMIKQTNAKILEVLKRDSEVLASIQQNFHAMIKNRDTPIDIFCFYEEQPLTTVGMVVPLHSAILAGYASTGISSNHVDMVKFAKASDPGFIAVSGELHLLVKKINAAEVSGPTSIGRSQDESRAHFLVPYSQNPYFVGRKEILDQLKRRLAYGETAAQPRISLCGLGGTGKTQIALAYVFWLHREYPDISVFWLHASTAERSRQAYASIAQECQIPGHEDVNTNILLLVKRWLGKKEHGRWLIVIDNADDIQAFRQSSKLTAEGISNVASSWEGGLDQFIPECAHGAVLITTRNKHVASRLTQGNPFIEIGKMDDDESCQLLRARLQESPTLAETLPLLASRLEHLPLALVQAAAFMQMNTLSVDDYIRQLDESDENLVRLLSEEFDTVGRDPGASHAVAATWMLSFNQIKRQDVFASELLSLMCLLDRHAIPIELLSNSCLFRKHRQDRNTIELEKSLGTLKAFSLVTEGESRSFNIHRLVQLVTKKWLDQNKIRQVERQAILTVWENFEDKKKCVRYVSHAQAVMNLIGTGSEFELLVKGYLGIKVQEILVTKRLSEITERFLQETKKYQEKVAKLRE
ncbi:P-loop containing nucleoside triphosphate hydrolase protein [Xylaria curta]|nr:P-loop containing nucleoside triphosphate hydrolase protein [Xylaria curta]